jgi:RHS repeat-associated protein
MKVGFNDDPVVVPGQDWWNAEVHVTCLPVKVAPELPPCRQDGDHVAAETWTYTALDQTHTQASLVPSANAYATTTDTYSKSAELTSTATTGATTASASYTYNADGEQATRSPNSGQTLTWDGQGDLTGVTKTTGGAAVAGYVYDAAGNLFTQTEGTKTTVYLPGEQLTIDTSTTPATLSGTRFYALPGGITAVRTGSGTAYGFELQSDEHGTNTLYLDSTAQNPTWRQFDPYGNPRGTAPATGFPGSRGFLNDPVDTATGLTSIGARWYDPATGTFASLDPLLEKASPAQLNGYTYAGANPIDSSDPTGLRGAGCNGPCPAPPRPHGHGTAKTGDASQPPTSSEFKLGPGAAFGPPAVVTKAVQQTISWFNNEPLFGPGVCGLHESSCPNFDQLLECFTMFQNCSGAAPLLGHMFFQHLCGLGGLDFCSGTFDGHFLSLLPRSAGWHDFGGGGEGTGEEGGGGGSGEGDAGGGGGAEGDPGVEFIGMDDPTGCGNSFTPGTGILLGNGKTAPIATLKPGDTLLATNTKTGKTGPETVAAVEVNHDTDLYDLKVKTSHGVQVIHTTSNHLFWDPYLDHGWTPANHLKPGERLKTADGTLAIVVGGSAPKVHDGWMWDLTVPGNNDHDFYVLTAVVGSVRTGNITSDGAPVLVHNCGTNPLQGTTYTQKVLAQIESGDNHGFPALIDTLPTMDDVSIVPGGDGVPRVNVKATR